jgi:hypothetical protein
MELKTRIASVPSEVPEGSWLAFSHDEKQLITFGEDLQDVLRRAKESGEVDPVVARKFSLSITFSARASFTIES